MKSLGAILVMLAAIGLAPPAPGQDDRVAVAAVLDALHQAASRAEGARYFSLFADDAVFFGTDATERWPIAEFRRYATARFDRGEGWTYTVQERHVYVAEQADVGWFDEVLENAKYGTCRGTGVVVKRGGVWKIAQIPAVALRRALRAHTRSGTPHRIRSDAAERTIPNAIAVDVVQMIKTTGRGG